MRITDKQYSHACSTIEDLAPRRYKMSARQSERLMKAVTPVFRRVLVDGGVDGRTVTRITTKLRDAGRRSPPWRPVSSRVPGRPQDGGDGNRTNRWLLPKNHKYHASQATATLVEIKYLLQTLSLKDAPDIGCSEILNLFHPWLIEHVVAPGNYLDPIQLVPIDFSLFANDRRALQCGHIIPLDRGGKHHPDNTFLMLFRSNQIQGNMTLQELIDLMRDIVKRHEKLKRQGKGSG